MRITIVLWTGALGDTLQLVPALRVLRIRYPQAAIHLCGPTEPGALLVEAGLLDSLSSASDPGLAPLASGKPSQTLGFALADPDLVIAFTSRTAEAAAALVSAGIPHIVGAPFALPGEHAAEHFVRLLAPPGTPSDWEGPESVSPLDILGLTHPSSDGPILLHPGSGSKWKCPPASLFQRLAGPLNENYRDVVVLEGPADAELVEAMGWTGSILRPGSVADLARVLKQSSAVIGNDSGVTHLSGLLGVATVAIFGPTHPVTWRPMGPRVAVVRTCTAPPAITMRVCDDPECFRDVTPELVLEALRRVEGEPETA